MEKFKTIINGEFVSFTEEQKKINELIDEVDDLRALVIKIEGRV